MVNFWLTRNKQVHRAEMSICTWATASSKVESTQGAASQKKNTKKPPQKNQQQKTRIQTGNFSNFYAVKLKFQMGSFRSHHAWQKDCFCLSGEKAKASLADMHNTQTLQRKPLLTVAGVRLVPLLHRSSCSFLFFLAILVTATLQNPFNSWDRQR